MMKIFKKGLCVLLAALILVMGMPFGAFAAVGEASTAVTIWDGTTMTAPVDSDNDGVYEINNAAELAYVIDHDGTINGTAACSFILTNDIYINDPSKVNWETGEVIGDYTINSWFSYVKTGNVYHNFQGTIDGDGYTIYGLYYKGTNSRELNGDAVALIPAIAGATTIKNLGVDNAYVDYTNGVSAFIGLANAGASATISNSYAGENVTLKGKNAGVFRATANSGAAGITLNNCYSLATAITTDTNSDHYDGLVAYIYDDRFTVVFNNCYNANGPLTNCAPSWFCSASNCYETEASAKADGSMPLTSGVTVMTAENMQGLDVFANVSKMPNLNVEDAFIATETYPVLKAFIDIGEETTANIIELDTPATVVISTENEEKTFCFTPETDGYYRFYSISEDNTDPHATLFNSDYNMLANNDDSNGYLDFSLVHYLTAGNTYVFTTGLCDGALGEFEVALTKTEARIAESVVFDDITIIEGENRGTREYYDEEENRVEYECYSYEAIYTVYYSDGTSEKYESTCFSDDLKEYYVTLTDSQSAENQWGTGNYIVTAEVSELSISETFTVSIIETPVDYVEVNQIVLIEGKNGYYTTDSIYNEETGEYEGESSEYYYYPVYASQYITLHLKDGSELTNEDGYFWNGEEHGLYHIDTADDQSYKNPWGAGTHTQTARILGYTFDYNVEILSTPVASITFDPVKIIENTHGGMYQDYLGIDEETGEELYSPSYFRYYDWYIYLQNIVITLNSGEVVYGSDIEWNGETYSIQYETLEQSYESQLTVGNTYQKKASLAGFDFTFDVSIVESPVANVTCDAMEYIEGTNGRYTTDGIYDEETGEYVGETPEYFRYDPYFKNIVITLKDGEVINGAEFEWEGKHYSLSADIPTQDYNNQWTAGNTYTGEFTVAGYNGTYSIKILETPVASITFDSVDVFENSEGGYTTDSIYNEETSEYEGETPEYYRYSYYSPRNVVITLKNGEVIENDNFVWGDEWYTLNFNFPEQNYENRWTVGNSYPVEASIAGYKFTYYINIIESPVASITFDDIKIPEFTNGHYTQDWYWDEELQQNVCSPEYFCYNLLWPKNIVITLKNGAVIESDSFEYMGRWYSLETVYPEQSYEKQWTVGNIYTGTASIAGYSVDFNIEITELTVNDCFEYIESEDSVTITHLFIEKETLEIPSEINGKPVTAVAELGYLYGVRHLIFPDSVEFIGGNVINDLSNLETVTFGSGICNLESYMFDYSDGLTEITVSEENPYFCTVDGVLYNKDMDTVIAYPVAKEGVYEVPITVTNIDALKANIYEGLELSFPEGHSLYVTIDGVTYNKDKTKVIFCSPSKEGAYEMPNTVTEIANGAFQNCNSLTEVKISENVSEIVYCAFYSCASLQKVDLPSGLVSIGEKAFQFNSSLESVELPGTLEYIGENAFSYSALTSLDVPDSVDVIEDNAFESNNIAELNLGNGVNEIHNWAFAGNPIGSVILPNSLTYLGEYAFCNCSELKTVSIGSGLDKLSEGVFESTGIESVTIPGTVKTIDEYAFGWCHLLANVILNEGLTAINHGAFYASDITSLNIPASVSYIDTTAFNYCSALESLTVSEGNDTYHSDDNCIIKTNRNILNNGCKTSVIPTDGSVTAIAENAFEGCENLTSITIPSTITAIGFEAFFGTGLTEITIPDSVETIGDAAFASSNLSTVVLGNGIKDMGMGVFAHCPITSIDLGRGLPYISENNFCYTDIESVLIPNSVTDIMYGAFAYCEELTSIELPLSVQSIDALAFDDCYNLSDVYYEGDEEDRANIDIDEEGNEYLLNATWHYNRTNDAWLGCSHIYDNACDAECNLCGETRTPSDHDFEWVVDKAEDCGNTGLKHEECLVCDAVRSENTVIEATGEHDFEWVVDKAEDCGNTGLKHEECSVCDAVRNENTVIEATGNHKFVWVTDKAEDCGNTGLKHEECSVCDAVRSENTVIEATGEHGFEWVVDKAADCGNTGLKHEECSVCDAIRSENTVISATGNHKFVWVTDKAADCGNTGLKHEECSVCDAVRNENTVISATGNHKHDNACDTTCNVCGTTRKVGPHKYTNDADTSCDYCEAKAYPGGNTLVNENGTWYHVVNRQKVNDTTLVNYGGNMYYVQNGVLKWGVETLVNHGGIWYYVKNSTVDFSAETLINYYGTWYYVNDGVVDWDSNTLCNYYGTWYYVKNGVVNWNANTLVNYSGSMYYVQNGQLKWGVETLVNYYGTWYYVKNSTVDFKAETLCNYYGTWYYVNDGVVDWDSETLCNYYGTWYYVKDGVVKWNAKTLVQYGGSWFYVQNGQLKWGVETLVNYYGTWYYVKNSTVDFKANLKFNYYGTYYNVVNGVVKF